MFKWFAKTLARWFAESAGPAAPATFTGVAHR